MAKLFLGTLLVLVNFFIILEYFDTVLKQNLAQLATKVCQILLLYSTLILWQGAQK